MSIENLKQPSNLIQTNKCRCGALKIELMSQCLECEKDYDNSKYFCPSCRLYSEPYLNGFICPQCHSSIGLSLSERKKFKSDLTKELQTLYQQCKSHRFSPEVEMSKLHKLWYIKTFRKKKTREKIILTLEEFEDNSDYKNRGYVWILVADKLNERRLFGVDTGLRKIKLNKNEPQKTINWCVSRAKNKLKVF